MTDICWINSPVSDEAWDSIDFFSTAGLADYKYVFVTPLIEFRGERDTYEGLTSLDDYWGPRTIAALRHWKNEIHAVMSAGANCICIAEEFREFYHPTGERRHSGTGRNRVTTRVVSKSSNFAGYFGMSGLRSREGYKMIRTKTFPSAFTDIYRILVTSSRYYVSLGTPANDSILVSADQKSAVGAMKIVGDGVQLILPQPNYWDEEFYDDSTEGWTERGREFVRTFVTTVVQGLELLRVSGTVDEAPTWVEAKEYSSDSEVAQLKKVQDLVDRQKEIGEELDAENRKLQEIRRLKVLLYGTGKTLEAAVREALILLGFEVSSLVEGDLEFDVIAVSEEGRLLGEVEGRDTKAIDVTKLRQLHSNIAEDYARDEIADIAKAVLFGNGLRFTMPDSRGDQFTQKCIALASAQTTCLVRTEELYRAAIGIESAEDSENYKKAVRTAILNGVGVANLIPTECKSSPESSSHTPQIAAPVSSSRRSA